MKSPAASPIELSEVSSLLPPIVQTLVGVIGLRATSDLVRQLGGTTFEVPMRQTRDGEAKFEALAEVIGPDAAAAMVRHFAGDKLYIPRCRAALTEYTYRQIRQTFDRLTRDTSAVQAVAVLAVRYGYADRHIWSILKMPDRHGDGENAIGAAGQLGLF